MAWLANCGNSKSKVVFHSAGGWEQLTCLEGWDWEWDEDKEEEEEDAERQRRKQLNIIIMWRGGRSRKYCFP